MSGDARDFNNMKMRAVIKVTKGVLFLGPSNYHLFPGLKKQLKGCHFFSDAEVIAAVETWLDGQPSEFFLSGLQKLEQRAKKCFELYGEYVE